MKFLIRVMILGLVLAGLGASFGDTAVTYFKDRNRLNFQFAQVTRGNLVAVINATGTVEPVRSVSVGSFVSGPIKDLYADFNDRIHTDDLLAKIDPRMFEADVARDEAILATREADVERAEALLQQATNEERRALELRDRNPQYISASELDEFKFKRRSLAAQKNVAKASVKEANANLEFSRARLFYTSIRSPVDGVVIERAVDTGQVVAATFQTPKLFVVAPNLEEEIHVHALVDEADIGLIRDAQRRGQPVYFTVDAYPDDLFEGKVVEIRMNSKSTQNVVTYPVMIAAANPDMKLMPGMTAGISFQMDERKDVVLIPNSALRFFPDPRYVRLADRRLLDGTADRQTLSDVTPSATDRATASRDRNTRHVWAVDGDLLKAITVTTGSSDNQFTEIVSGELAEGQRIVTSIRS